MLQKRKRGLRLREEGGEFSFYAPIRLEKLYTRRLYNGSFCRPCRYNRKTTCTCGYDNYCNAWRIDKFCYIPN